MKINSKDVGVVSFGIKTGIITFDDNISDVIKKYFLKNKSMIQTGDIVCITEAIVGITQHNFVTLDSVVTQIKSKLKLKEDSTVGLLYPILSRNRFSMLLKAIARTVPKGKVIIQLLFPDDEQGNQIINKEFYSKKLKKSFEDKISEKEIGKNRYIHPETSVDYISLYKDIINKEGAKAEVYLANSTKYMVENKPDAIIVCNVHHREDTLNALKARKYKKTISLQHVFNDPSKKVYSEYGLLGSNILDPVNETIKLAPKNGDVFCKNIQKMIKKEFKKDVEVLIYGDGAYKDPESGIYELADPVSCFGVTPGIKNRNRIGVKTKFLMQKLYNEGKSKKEILKLIEIEKQKFLKTQKKDSFSAEGTTPRKIENLVCSLADLVSGSADANTPIVVVRGFF
ncbi:MAG: coenzyme F420-0:L-glutamate ligase [archaeon]|jgi:F420-0:gamma-glutamyl ligase|nr:coenzyme F420-0:L-glutamate ligase [archaeon]MDD2477380.1 coenzyme F420-0:L-glutamate ligase [Candidatus ainarchaeum sp.]MDD3084507.1 coenzyme F420-0:L-glutamate ligase [Candidatus ainarchaeum sp.]MDD4220788.1 coenzyme F420-0:L-glutamate ligase [Candidatus ainarchaeum sp.]MDD4662287.1 coenzyme F420-0:L-glutamate ligase [Candidatus ainarchaeum sp.]